MSPRVNNFDDKQQIYREEKTTKFKQNYDWTNIIVIGGLHLLSLYGFWLILTFNVKWQTLLFNTIYAIFTNIGVFGGGHRLWSHRSFKAKKPLRFLLVLLQTAALQKDVYQWAREHRVHHKHVDTDADPHNVNRGFFYSHMGWLFFKKHPRVIEEGKKIDLSDVASDPVVIFQRKYYFRLVLLLTLLLPVSVPMYFWGEPFISSLFATITRFIVTANGTGLINSVSHMYGYKPYDKAIRSTENLFVSFFSGGEGWHNYHHTFPWDYRAAEFANYELNFTTAFLDLMAYIGQVYDMKTPSKELVEKIALKKGDGSWSADGHSHENSVWGWGDKDLKGEIKENVIIYK